MSHFGAIFLETGHIRVQAESYKGPSRPKKIGPMIFRFKKKSFPFRAPEHSVFSVFTKFSPNVPFFCVLSLIASKEKVHCKPNADWSIGHHTSQSESRRQSAYVSVAGRVCDACQGKLSSFLPDFNIKKAKKRGENPKKGFSVPILQFRVNSGFPRFPSVFRDRGKSLALGLL